METRKRDKIKRGLIATTIMLFALMGKAQMKKANQYYESLQYSKAIELYLKVLEKGEDSLAIKNIAESYRRINDTKQAELFYKRAAVLYPEDKQIQLTYAQLLKSNSKLDEAKEVFIVYVTKNPGDILGQKYILSCDQIKSWVVEVPNFETQEQPGINTEASDFCAVPFENGVAFVTDRFVDHVAGSETGTESPYLKIAYAEQEDSTYKKVKPIKDFNNNYHSGPICFNQNQTLAVFTRVDVAKKQDKEFINRPQLYISKKEGNSWSKPVPFEYNDINYSFAHASLSPDGSMLFFASDKKGGQGGFDIYVCKKQGEGWSAPENLGKKVNTRGNEVFPHSYSNDTLYFSSNTLVGFGGQDIFYTTYQDNEWTTPMNLKNEVNSPKDDFGIIFIDKKRGFFSSNREGGLGKDDIYAFSLIRELKERTSVSGIFLYAELDPAKGAIINLLDEDGNIIMVTETKEDGSFIFEDLEADRNYVFMIDKDDSKLSSKSKIYLTNEQGEKIVALNQPGVGMFKFRSLPPDEIAALPTLQEEDVELTFVDIFGQLYDKLPGDYSEHLKVLLVDESGEVLYTTDADSVGNFAFENVLPLSNYKIMLSPDTTLKMMFTDGEGNKVADAERNEEGEYDYKKQEFLTNSNIFGRVYNKLPGDFEHSIKVYLVDDEGNVVYETTTDENGDFVFENLPPDKNYIVKFDEEDAEIKLLLSGDGTKEGNLAMKNAKGEYVIEPEKETALDFFGRVYQKLPGDFGKQMDVYLVDDEGNIVYQTTTDENGDFVFENLPPDHQYIVKLATADTEFKLIKLDENKEPQEVAQLNEKGKYVLEAEKEPATDFFGRVYQKLPGDYNKSLDVYLVDDDGNIVYQTTTDENGDFVFENLPPDHNYKIKLQDTEESLSMVVLDEFGQVSSKAKVNDDGNFEVAEETSINSLFGNIYQKLPGDYSQGMEVYLVDDDGNIVYQTTTDENGDFVFENLPPDHNYKLKLKEANEGMSMVVLNDFGTMEEVNSDASGSFDVSEKPKKDIYGNFYNTIPGDITTPLQISLIDEKGVVVYQTKTDKNGNFSFRKLPADINYQLRLETPSDDISMIMLNEDGEMLSKANNIGNGVYEIEEPPSLYGRVFNKLPGDFNKRMPVYLVDDEGNIVYETTTDENGDFVFENLPPDHNFSIKFKDGFDDANVIILDELGNEITKAEKQEDGAFAFKQEEETASIFGKAYNKLPGDFGQKMEVYLLNDEGDIVFTTTTDENGDFVFENLPKDKNYIIRFEAQDVDMKLMVLDHKGNEIEDISQAANGDFNYEYLSSQKQYISLLTLDDAIIKIREDDKFTMVNLYFEYNSYTLTSEAKKELDKLVILLKKNPHVGLDIKGHTDNKGTDEYNMKLSNKRAVAVVNYIVSKGINKIKITGKGYGESRPIAPNQLPNGEDNPKGREKNRRTEINIVRVR